MFKPGDIVTAYPNTFSGREVERRGFVLGEILAVELWPESPDGLLVSINILMLRNNTEVRTDLRVNTTVKWYGSRVKLINES